MSEKSPMPDLPTASPTSRDDLASMVLQSRNNFLDLDVVAKAPVSGVRNADLT